MINADANIIVEFLGFARIFALNAVDGVDDVDAVDVDCTFFLLDASVRRSAPEGDCAPVEADCTPAEADCTPVEADCAPVEADCTLYGIDEPECRKNTRDLSVSMVERSSGM